MSARNGDKARHEKNRKRRIHQRVKIKALVASHKEATAQSGGAGTK